MTAPPRLATLAEIEAALWRELLRAPLDRHHEWRTPVLATADDDGADARTVVLREAQADARALRLFTDARSPKVAQMARRPQGTLVMWSRRLGWQLRVRVHLQVQVDGLAVASHWARLKQSPAAQDYLSPLAPGSPLDGAAPGRPAPERGHFALLTAQVLAIDWLELHADGHRRAGFDTAGSRWLVP
jgi:pyridoxamine 5'-phosphate oxidase